MATNFRAGDTVKHAPTGETWLVALDSERGRVYWCGYPFGGSGDAEDCTLIEAASDEKRMRTLDMVVASKDSMMASMAKKQKGSSDEQ